jgi:signal transduction histidine kinase
MVAEHSKGDRVYVSIIKKGGKLYLKVEENGKGFDLHRLLSETKGVGLERMKQRAELSGGSLSIESGEALGMSIRASWPIDC